MILGEKTRKNKGCKQEIKLITVTLEGSVTAGTVNEPSMQLNKYNADFSACCSTDTGITRSNELSSFSNMKYLTAFRDYFLIYYNHGASRFFIHLSVPQCQQCRFSVFVQGFSKRWFCKLTLIQNHSGYDWDSSTVMDMDRILKLVEPCT